MVSPGSCLIVHAHRFSSSTIVAFDSRTRNPIQLQNAHAAHVCCQSQDDGLVAAVRSARGLVPFSTNKTSDVSFAVLFSLVIIIDNNRFAQIISLFFFFFAFPLFLSRAVDSFNNDLPLALLPFAATRYMYSSSMADRLIAYDISSISCVSD